MLIAADFDGSFGDLETSADVSTVGADFGSNDFHGPLVEDLNAVEP